MKKSASPTAGGFWMETEPLFPERKVFRPVILRNEKGVIFMKTQKDATPKEQSPDTVKVIAI